MNIEAYTKRSPSQVSYKLYIYESCIYSEQKIIEKNNSIHWKLNLLLFDKLHHYN